MEDVINFFNDFKEGLLEPHYRSEPIPWEPKLNGLTFLVGKTHDKIVNDPTKDVFVFYYARWCDHSQWMGPVWYELAELLHMEDDHND